MGFTCGSNSNSVMDAEEQKRSMRYDQGFKRLFTSREAGVTSIIDAFWILSSLIKFR